MTMIDKSTETDSALLTIKGKGGIKRNRRPFDLERSRSDSDRVTSESESDLVAIAFLPVSIGGLDLLGHFCFFMFLSAIPIMPVMLQNTYKVCQ